MVGFWLIIAVGGAWLLGGLAYAIYKDWQEDHDG